jgi:hypothetical protein
MEHSFSQMINEDFSEAGCSTQINNLVKMTFRSAAP